MESRTLLFVSLASAGIYGAYRSLPKYTQTPTLRSGLSQLLYAYRECDENEWLVCDKGHKRLADKVEDWSENCPVCGGETGIIPWRNLALSLAWQTIEDSFKPTHLTEWDMNGKKSVERTYVFRGRRLFSRQVTNDFLV
jgi:hypothetical protein